jgi:hypothetical protein
MAIRTLKKNVMALIVSCIATHGLAGDDPRVDMEGISTLTALTASSSAIENEYFASFDISATLPTAHGLWSLVIEANSTPRIAGVSTFLPDANNDVGSALDGSGQGRIQLSGLHYGFVTGHGKWTVGLLNAGDYVDTSEVANDEKTQFLNSSFVNNPTIALPDYSLGFSYSNPSTGNQPGYAILVTGSHGLGDNDSASYADLAKLGENGKGVFVAAEAHWETDTVITRIGAWASSAHRPVPIDQHDDQHFGAYAVLDGRSERLSWNARAGVAHSDRSRSKYFLGIATDIPIAENALGIALGHSVLNESAAGALGSTQHVEIYYRFSGFASLELTPSIQLLHKDNVDQGKTDNTSTEVVIGVRLGLRF